MWVALSARRDRRANPRSAVEGRADAEEPTSATVETVRPGKALASSQAARIDSQAEQIADLQAMLGNALAALSPMATPQGPLPPIQSPESVELWEILGHFGL